MHVGHEIVKLGKTEDLPRRLSDLFSTGVPTRFEVYKALVVPDMHKYEKLMHRHFNKCRVTTNREFFDIPLHMIDTLFDMLLDHPDIEKYDDDDIEEINLEESKGRQSYNVKLSDLGIVDGDVLTYEYKGNPVEVIVCRADESLVTYKGETRSLSGAAKDIAIDNGAGPKTEVSGWKAFTYDGKQLAKLRGEYMKGG